MAARWARVLARAVAATLLTVVGLAAVAAVAVLVLTNTDWGLERVRRIAESRLRDIAHGQVEIGRITGSVLSGMTIHDLVIRDSIGRTFLAVRAVRGEYSLRDLWQRRIVVRNALVVRPLLMLDRPSRDGDWNWERIFPRDRVRSGRTGPRWGDWIVFTNVQVVDGEMIVRTPWNPSRNLRTAAARDSATRAALRGESRVVIEPVRGGFQKVVRLRSVTATLPLLRVAQPGYDHGLARVASLETQAYPFRPPAADIVNVTGDFRFDDDSVWWKGVRGHLPHSAASGSGRYTFKGGDLTLAIHASPALSGDMRWIYPRLPANAAGSADFTVTWNGAVEDYVASRLDFALDGARVQGRFGLWRGDSLRFHDTDLRFANVSTRTLEQLVPDFTSPRRGTLSGRAAFSGGRNALDIDGDVTFADAAGAGTSRVLARGEIGFPQRGIHARDLHLRLQPLQVALLRTYQPTLPIAGQLTGEVTVTGSPATVLRLVASLELRDRGTLSAVSGTATIGGGGTALNSGRWTTARLDADLRAHPLSLVEVGRFMPDVGLHGVASGPIRLRGTLGEFDIDTDLRLADGGGGQFAARGHLDITGAEPRYDLTAGLRTVNLRSVLLRAPLTSLTATAMARGTGTDPATMRTTVGADLSTSRWDSVAVDTASVRVTVADGVARVARLQARGAHTTATATGSFGLVRGTTGTLDYRVAIDSLGAYNRWIPGSGVDTGVVAPRPGLVAQAVQRARADSIRVAKRTEVERFVTGRPSAPLSVTMPRSVRRDTIGGTLFAAGTVTGNVHEFDLRGRAGGEHVTARGSFVRHVRAEYAWTGVRTPSARIVVGLDADSVMVEGFMADTVRARVSYAASAGHAEVVMFRDPDHDYAITSDFTLAPSGNELRLASFRARLDTVVWQAPHPAMIRWGGPGVEVVNFELVNRAAGRIYAHGLLPTEGVANFAVSISGLPTADILDLVQSDVDLDGLITLAGHMRGTLRVPTFSGAFALERATYRGAALPRRVQGTFAYESRSLEAHLTGFRDMAGGAPLFVANGRFPIDLTLGAVPGKRLLDEPMVADLVADSLPLDLLPHLTDAVSNVRGLVSGRVALRGRLARPSLAGGLMISNGTVTINETGQTIDQISGMVRMEGDTVFLGARPLPGATSTAHVISGVSRDSVRLRGTIAVGNWRAPVYDLYLWARNAEVVHNNLYGRVRADVLMSFQGPLEGGYLSGNIAVREGVIRAPEATARYAIGSGDPGLFAVLDTSLAGDRELFPRRPLWRSMRMDVKVEVRRNTWVRNRDANVEIYTDYPLDVVVRNEALALTGVVTTDRGEYSFMSKRFQIRRGSAMFIGSSDLNPTLQVTGEYEVKVASAATVGVKVLIGGTLRRPSLSLESDIQPPRSQAELLSLLAFGQSSSSLLALEGSSISGFGTGDLVGLGASLAVRRMAGVALGVAVDEIETEAGRMLGTDQLNITPADVPTELWQGRGLSNLLSQTSVEAGKYLNSRTFLGLKTIGFVPGASLQYRRSSGWRYEAIIQPRIVIPEPSLSQQVLRSRWAFGGFIFREWRW